MLFDGVVETLSELRKAYPGLQVRCFRALYSGSFICQIIFSVLLGAHQLIFHAQPHNVNPGICHQISSFVTALVATCEMKALADRN